MSGSSEFYRSERSADAMGSTYSIIVYGAERANVEAAIDEAFDEVRRLEEMLSNYRPDSEWSAVNREASHRPVKVTPELFQLLSVSLSYSLESEGAFDITVGPLMRAWGFFRDRGRLADPVEVGRANEAVGYQHLRLDAIQRTVSFARSGMEICPGGIGKGYTVDRMIGILKRRGIDTALVAASRSSIYGLGAPPSDPRGWRVDVRDPAGPKKALAQVHLKDQSLSTSGTFENCFRANGRVYSHIIDPRTGCPVEGTLLVSVMAPLTLDSEAWAKILIVNGSEWSASHKPGDFRAFFLEGKAGRAGTWLW